MTGFVLFVQPLFVFLCIHWTIEGVLAGRLVEFVWLVPAAVIATLWVLTYRTHLDTARIRGRIEQIDKQIAQERSLRLISFDAEEVS